MAKKKKKEQSHLLSLAHHNVSEEYVKDSNTDCVDGITLYAL